MNVGESALYKSGTATILSDYPPINEGPIVKKKIKLRKINPQEKQEIFKDYYERKRELSPLKFTTSKNFFAKKPSSTTLGKTDDTRASQRIDTYGKATLLTGSLFDSNASATINRILGEN